MLPLLALLVACGPDSPPQECHGAPDFSVLITASDGPLPPDTVVKLYYGARGPEDPEVLVVAAPETPQALFCYVSDKNGLYDAEAKALGSAPSTAAYSNGGAGGESGAGGASNGGTGPIEGLVCKLYTDGSARVEVQTAMYDLAELKLSLKKDVCTVDDSITLEATDAGMAH